MNLYILTMHQRGSVKSVCPYIVLFSSNPKSFYKLIGGMFIFLSGALGFEFLSNFYSSTHLILITILEEGFEMLGITVIAWSLYEIVHFKRIIK